MTTTTPYSTPAIAAAIARTLAAARDRPNPAEDAHRTPEKYARMSQDFRRSAWKHLDENDLAQASNKAWGLVAETVKAISAHHGGVIHTHRAVLMVTGELGELAARSGDTAMRDWINNAFSVARNMHTNFYENELSVPQVTSNLRQCEELSQCLYQLFWPEGANAAPPDDSA